MLPKHYWETRNFAEPLTEIPLGSGAYTVKDYKIGQYVVYERLKNYWGMDLPVNKGQLNFDFLRYDYYRDENVALEAFKAGEYDLREENVAKSWATLYTGPTFDAGQIVKEEIPHEIPQGMQAMVFNIQRPFFKDRLVRMALNYAMDFEWMNKNLFYGQYTRTRSYFQNTKYAATGLPSKEELKILEPLRGKIPEEVFTKEYNPPVTDGTGNIRPQIQTALDILKKAGWEIRDQKLTNVKTGEPMVFELLIDSPTMERVAIPVQKNLERMGITMNIRTVDSTQFTNRLRERDFDMISGGYSANFYPSTDLKIVWRSDYLDYTYNTAGVQDPAVDYLIDGIEANQENERGAAGLGPGPGPRADLELLRDPRVAHQQVPGGLLEQVRPAGGAPQVLPGHRQPGGSTRPKSRSFPSAEPRRAGIMAAYIARRLLLMIPTLWAIITVNFFIVQVAPGGPVDQAVAEARGMGASGTMERISGEGASRRSAAAGGRHPEGWAKSPSPSTAAPAAWTRRSSRRSRSASGSTSRCTCATGEC